MTNPAPIRPRDREAILQSLRAGVVPRTGIRSILVGRVAESRALTTDLETLKEGGSAFRLVIGDYGSGKSFFLALARSIALERNFVTMSADLTPMQRLNATQGQARALYAALAASTATRTRPDGGAMMTVVERFVEEARAAAAAESRPVEQVIHERLAGIREMPVGYDFADVVAAYARGRLGGNEALAEDAVRWLRGEFSTRTDSRSAISVRTIVGDTNFHDVLKLFARFVRAAGYSGLLVTIDELVNLYNLAHTQARNANYERILGILNDSLQGQSVGLGIYLGGTPPVLYDTRKGMFSYPALESRLAANPFARDGLIDVAGPVIQLGSLTPENLYVLLGKVHEVYAAGRPGGDVVPEEAYVAFMEHCQSFVGDAYYRSPRLTIKSFVELLAVIDQNPEADWRELLGQTQVIADREPDLQEHDETGAPVAPEDGGPLATFRIAPPTAPGA